MTATLDNIIAYPNDSSSFEFVPCITVQHFDNANDPNAKSGAGGTGLFSLTTAKAVKQYLVSVGEKNFTSSLWEYASTHTHAEILAKTESIPKTNVFAFMLAKINEFVSRTGIIDSTFATYEEVVAYLQNLGFSIDSDDVLCLNMHFVKSDSDK